MLIIKKNHGSFALIFEDVNDSIRQFNGKHNYLVRKWITGFKEIARLTRWKELQKLTYTKKSITGVAKLFIQSEKSVKF